MRAAGVSDETIAARRADALALYLDRLEAALNERPPSSSRGFSPFSTRSRTCPASFSRS